MKVAAIAGGTGSAKILRGLSALKVELTVVGNVGDNFHFHGLYVCPDLDIATYSLAGVADPVRGWGLRGDSFTTMDQFAKMGVDSWFRLGDRDMATQILRRGWLDAGMTLTQATDLLRRSFGVGHPVLPISDDPVETYVLTPRGPLHLQEFWVRDGGRPRVAGVEYRGASFARPTSKAVEAVEQADRVVICPANPVTSVGPILAIPSVGDVLARARARVSALSPMIGKAPFSGPAAKLMKAVRMRTDSVGVAERYAQFLDSIVIDRSDEAMKGAVKDAGVDCAVSDTRIRGGRDEVRLARELLEA